MSAKKCLDTLTDLGLHPTHAAELLLGLPSWFNVDNLLAMAKNNLPAAIAFLQDLLLFAPQGSSFASALQALLKVLKALQPAS